MLSSSFISCLRLLTSLLLISSFRLEVARAQTPYPLTSGLYSEDFSSIGTWTTNFGGPTQATRYSAASPVSGTGQPTQNSVFATGFSGGVQRGTQTIVLLATGTNDGGNAAAFDLNLNFTGTTAGTISLAWASVNNQTGNRQATFKLQTNTGAAGTFVDLPGSAVVVVNGTPSTGQLTNLSLPAAFDNMANAKIRFFLVTSSGGTFGSRPRISLDNVEVKASSVPLPITLVSFTAKAIGRDAQLTWRTAQEVNNRAFVVERSLDGHTFSAAHTIAGRGTSSAEHTYAHTDLGALDVDRTVYYRLQQVDTDGSAHYSPIVAIRSAAGVSAAFYLLPNPARGQVQLIGALSPTLQLLDLTGRVLRTQASTQPVALTGLNPGIYLVHCGSHSARLQVE
ncbi:T9SS type A sorting domain-containing protein [Hymenobacter sp. BT664]|uniref:T9SS type A sorting domain-containing protein n=1 Tax=Hymenobacter montanus TaxID=2771359 RepID=A0A927BAH0_9BACT|nr:T9SS type A sorting domain-containing protein [Hymenobacter montanus]MBD2767150.1 T9SS type A sorting domain-containing protein [Hymenobacter montanus]